MPSGHSPPTYWEIYSIYACRNSWQQNQRGRFIFIHNVGLKPMLKVTLLWVQGWIEFTGHWLRWRLRIFLQPRESKYVDSKLFESKLKHFIFSLYVSCLRKMTKAGDIGGTDVKLHNRTSTKLAMLTDYIAGRLTEWLSEWMTGW